MVDLHRDERRFLSTHRVHDYRHLARRWREVARRSGLRMERFAVESEYPIYVVRNSRAAATGGLYISAGIHGDEPAGVEALIAWAEKNIKRLTGLPCFLFPCLNPWGLVNNSRFDQQGRDLNRHFHSDDVIMIRTLKQLIAPYKFDLALALHEDYDGQGLYIYELERAKPFWGELLLDLARPLMPIEGRTTIEGRRSLGGIVRRRLSLKRFPMLPEAVYLHAYHATRTFTIETPSEFGLDQRVTVHRLLIEECVRRTFLKAKRGSKDGESAASSALQRRRLLPM